MDLTPRRKPVPVFDLRKTPGAIFFGSNRTFLKLMVIPVIVETITPESPSLLVSSLLDVVEPHMYLVAFV